MSSNPVISVSRLGKRYSVRHEQQQRYVALRDVIADGITSFWRRLFDPRRSLATKGSLEDFWALKDINFTLVPGERLGIIGRNGAGKSTLLKILSRITDPSEGRIEIRGRVSSLLEVGTGFHPELTGRENIFLNGAILGMSSGEIRRKFDEIVAFAEIERFLDTPVKRYSSGMYVRLAFSVAAHLEPDILIIDEVLAVGDAQFQKKCLGKMRDVTGEGRTVIFVSHNMTTVNSLCDRCLLLEQGRVKSLGGTVEVTKLYFGGGAGNGSELRFDNPEARLGDSVARLVHARLVNGDRDLIEFARIDQPVGIEMTFEVLVAGLRLVPNFHIFTQGQYAFVSSPASNSMLDPGVYRSTMWIPARLLNEGLYYIGLALTSVNPLVVHFNYQDAMYFSVLDDLRDPSRNDYTLAVPGIIRPRLEWDVQEVDEAITT